MICPRCHGEVIGYGMSWFNTEEICLDCKNDEFGAPNYVKARVAEAASLRRGERNFPGIGLAPEDLTYLAARREQRQQEEQP